MNILEHLTKIANILDAKGFYDEANEIDGLVEKIASKHPQLMMLEQKMREVENAIHELEGSNKIEFGGSLHDSAVSKRRLDDLHKQHGDIGEDIKYFKSPMEDDADAPLDEKSKLLDRLKDIEEQIDEAWGHKDENDIGWRMRLSGLLQHRDDIREQVKALESDKADDFEGFPGAPYATFDEDAPGYSPKVEIDARVKELKALTDEIQRLTSGGQLSPEDKARVEEYQDIADFKKEQITYLKRNFGLNADDQNAPLKPKQGPPPQTVKVPFPPTGGGAPPSVTNLGPKPEHKI